MKQVTITVSDNDFAHMVRHLSRQLPGRALVAVESLIAIDGDEEFNLEEEVAGGVE